MIIPHKSNIHAHSNIVVPHMGRDLQNVDGLYGPVASAKSHGAVGIWVAGGGTIPDMDGRAGRFGVSTMVNGG